MSITKGLITEAGKLLLGEGTNTTPKLEGEVTHISGAWLYGHYDSRGGATLILAKDRKQADEMYLRTFAGGDDDKEYIEMLRGNGLLEEDFMFGPIDVITFGTALPEPGKSDFSDSCDLTYGEEFKEYLLDKGAKTVALLLAKPQDIEIKLPKGFKISDEYDELGEDAFGIQFYKAN